GRPGVAADAGSLPLGRDRADVGTAWNGRGRHLHRSPADPAGSRLKTQPLLSPEPSAALARCFPTQREVDFVDRVPEMRLSKHGRESVLPESFRLPSVCRVRADEARTAPKHRA